MADFPASVGPTITTIVGPTDAGKSAILRALRWACLNDLGGTDFIREGQKKTMVTLVIEDKGLDFRIFRSKSADGSVNTYGIEDKIYRSMGRDVPKDIAGVLQLNEINFQFQHDAPFWFSETAGEVSRRLNAVIDLSVIDSSLGYVAGQLRNAQERKKVCEERLKEAQKELVELEPVERRIKDFEKLKTKFTAQREAQEAHSALERVLGRADPDKAKHLLKKSDALAALFDKAKEARQASIDFSRLDELLNNVEERQSIPKPPDFTSVENAYVILEEAEKRWLDLTSLVDSIAAKAKKLDEKKKAAEHAQTEFSSAVKGKSCPTCGNLFQ